MVEIVAAWTPEEEEYADKHRLWALDLSNALAPAALPGEYPHRPDPGEKDQIAHAYGSNIAKLLNRRQHFMTNAYADKDRPHSRQGH